MEALLTILIIILFVVVLSLRQEIYIFRNQINNFQSDYNNKLSLLKKRIEKLEKNTSEPTTEYNDEHAHAETPIKAKTVEHSQNNIENQNINTAKIHEAPIISTENKSNNEIKESTSKSFDLESLFLGNVFSKIGGIILVLAICFLVKFSSNYIEFTPQLNITLGYIVSLSMLGYSIFIFQKEKNITAEILSGVGLSGLLLATYFGCFYYSLFPIQAALIIAFLIVLASFAISLKYNSFATIAIGLFGGYLNPAIFSHDISIGLIFGYLIALNLISVTYTYKNGNKNLINCVNIFLTIITLAIFSYKGTVSIAYPIILWLLYIGYDILTTLTKSEQDKPQVLRWFNFVALIYITNHVFGFTNLTPIGLTVLGIGALYGVIYYVFKAKNEDISFTALQSSLICLLFMTYYLVKFPYLGLIWAVEGYLVTELYIKIKNENLQKYVLLFFITSVIYLLINYQTMFAENTAAELVAIICLVYMAQAALMVYSGIRLNKLNKYLSTNIKMLGATTFYLYLAFYFSTIEIFKHSKLYIEAIISSIYSLHSYKILSKDFKNISETISYAFYIIAAVLLILAEILSINDLNYIPILNIKFASYLTLIALSLYFAKYKNVCFQYIAIVLGMFSLVGQIMCIFQNIIPEDTMPLILTTFLIIYSAVILTVGILKNITSMKQTSICLILLLLIKLIFIDLYNIDAIFKLIAFVIIGFILLGVSQYYQKMKK